MNVVSASAFLLVLSTAPDRATCSLSGYALRVGFPARAFNRTPRKYPLIPFRGERVGFPARAFNRTRAANTILQLLAPARRLSCSCFQPHHHRGQSKIHYQSQRVGFPARAFNRTLNIDLKKLSKSCASAFLVVLSTARQKLGVRAAGTKMRVGFPARAFNRTVSEHL